MGLTIYLFYLRDASDCAGCESVAIGFTASLNLDFRPAKYFMLLAGLMQLAPAWYFLAAGDPTHTFTQHLHRCFDLVHEIMEQE